MKNYLTFLESKKVVFTDDNKDKIDQTEMDLIANIIHYFDEEAEVDEHPGWEDVEGYVTCVTGDEIHFGVKYDFHHLDGEVERNSEIVIIDRKSGKWTHQPEEITESLSESLKSKSDKGNRYFKMLKTGMFQHYDSPKGELSKIGNEEDRKRLVSKLSKEDKKTYKEWLKTPEGKDSLLNFK